MIDFDNFRRHDGTIELEDVFTAMLNENMRPEDYSRLSDAGIEAALAHIRCIETFQPIKAKQVATIVAANAYSLALAYTQFSTQKEAPQSIKATYIPY